MRDIAVSTEFNKAVKIERCIGEDNSRKPSEELGRQLFQTL